MKRIDLNASILPGAGEHVIAADVFRELLDFFFTNLQMFFVVDLVGCDAQT